MTPPLTPRGALAGRELDAQVAEKVMGYVWDKTRCRVCGWPLTTASGSGSGGCIVGNCCMRPRPIENADAPAYYSTDIAAAWPVMERLRSDGWDLNFGANTEGWWIIGSKPSDDLVAEADGETFPLCVCRFAVEPHYLPDESDESVAVSLLPGEET